MIFFHLMKYFNVMSVTDIYPSYLLWIVFYNMTIRFVAHKNNKALYISSNAWNNCIIH